MRIRKRLPLSTDLQLRRSEAAPPPHPPPDQRWVFPQNEEKEFGDDHQPLRVEANDDIRKIVHICDGSLLHPPSSSVQELKVVPLKKRKGSFERNPTEKPLSGKMKSKTNKKCDDLKTDQKPLMDISTSGSGGAKRGTVIVEGSRCSRVNGRGWRCCQPTLMGYSLCEHHLGKGRLRSMAAVRRGGGDSEEDKPGMLVAANKRRKVGVVKARSMTSLLTQI